MKNEFLEKLESYVKEYPKVEVVRSSNRSKGITYEEMWEYNGVTSLKYIETILYNWRKKGYRNKKEIMEAKSKYRESKKEEVKDVFYYDWLNDD